jgi:hypothetical protein
MGRGERRDVEINEYEEKQKRIKWNKIRKKREELKSKAKNEERGR